MSRWDCIGERITEMISAQQKGHLHAPLMAEIGTWWGKTTLELLRKFPTLRIVTVDPYEFIDPPGWICGEGLENVKHEGRAYLHNVYRGFSKNLLVCGCMDRSYHLRMTSSHASEIFRGWKGFCGFDVVFIDANHSYADVSCDIELWWPLVRFGGVLCGHDYNHQNPVWGVKRAVDEWVEKSGLEDRLEFGTDLTWFVGKERGEL